MICCHFLSPPRVVSQKTCWDQWSHMAGGHFYPFTRFPISHSKLLITYCASEIQSMEEMPRKSHSRIFLWPYQSLSHCLTQDNTWKLLLSDWEIHFGQSRFSQQQGVETSYFITNTTFYKKKTSHLLSFNPEVNLSFKDFDLITYIKIVILPIFKIFKQVLFEKHTILLFLRCTFWPKNGNFGTFLAPRDCPDTICALLSIQNSVF